MSPSTDELLASTNLHAPCRLVHVDMDGRIVAMTRAAMTFLEASSDGAPTLELQDVMPQAREVLAHVAGGVPWRDDACAFTVGGRTVEAAAEAFPILRHGKPIGATIGIPRKGEAMQRVYEEFFEQSEDLFCIASPEGRFLHVSPSWSRVTGWRPDELTARPYVEFVHPEDRDATAGEAEKLEKGPTTVLRFENRYRCRDGSYRWLQWNAYAPPGGNVYAVARDVTLEKGTATQLEVAHHAVESTERAYHDFMQNALHDLAGALTPIRITVATLRHQQGQGQRIDRMERLVQHLEALVKDIRDALSIGQGRFQLEKHQLSMADALRPTLQAYQEVAAAKGIRFDSRLAQAHVEADPFRLNQVMHNLLSNAFKFTPKGGHVHVEAQEGVEGLRVAVEDTGRGLEPDEIKKLFQPFVQVHKPDEVKERGTGLGLHISRQIVEAHGGRIWVESQGHGHGSAFRFTIPLTDAKSDHEAASLAPSPEGLPGDAPGPTPP